MEERGGGHHVRSGLVTVQSVLKDLRSLFLPNRNQFKVLPPFWIVQLLHREGAETRRRAEIWSIHYTLTYLKSSALWKFHG
ncbi:hypothetical protein VPH35_035081 [Triticum aestivum]